MPLLPKYGIHHRWDSCKSSSAITLKSFRQSSPNFQIIPNDLPDPPGGDAASGMASSGSREGGDVDFSSIIPPHSLLDVSASKSKAELAHKGLLSSRQRPSTEALRATAAAATAARKSVSHTSSTASFHTVSVIQFFVSSVALIARVSCTQFWAKGSPPFQVSGKSLKNILQIVQCQQVTSSHY